MKILKQKHDDLWITVISNGRWVQAKVYNEPSDYGVNDGRVSKLSIGKTDKRDQDKNFFNQMAYNYDRGTDFDNLPDGLLNLIVADLEVLPPLYKANQQ